MQCNGIWKVHCCQYLTYFAVYMTGGERVALPIGAMSATNPRSVQIVSASSGLYVRSCRSVTTVNRPLNLA